MRNNKGISMITLIITIIVMIILAAIAFMAAGDQVGSAQFSKFASEFGEYATNFENAPLAEVTEALGLTGKATNKAQKIYAAARDVDLKNFDSVLNGVIVPGGYTSPRFQTDIKDGTGATVELASSTTPSYEIKDNIMKEYDGKKFYGDANGKETHWVTAGGTVFTIPGFPRVVDGEERMYITPDLYYVSTGADMITADDLIEIAPSTVGGDVVTGSQTAADAADSVTPGDGGEDDEEDASNFSNIKVGDYVAYTPDTPASVQWRVWETNGSNVVIMPTSSLGSLTLGNSSDINEGLSDYNTAVEQIEALCDNYASSALGVTTSDVRSLTIEDLEDESVSTLAIQKLSYSSGDVTYGDIKTYTSGNYFGASYDGSKNNISSTFISASSSLPVMLKKTYYYLNAPGWKTLPDSSDTYGTLLGSALSWLASTCANCLSSRAYFSMYAGGSGDVGAQTLFTSDGITASYSNGVRPLVYLSGNRLTVDETNPGDGSSATPWNIVKK